MRKSSFSISVALLIVAVSGCSQLDQSITDCDNLSEEIVEMSEEDRQSRGYALVKIREPKTLSNLTIKFHAVDQLYGPMETRLPSHMKAISMRMEIG